MHPKWSVTGSPNAANSRFRSTDSSVYRAASGTRTHHTDEWLWNGRGQPCELRKFPVGTAVDKIGLPTEAAAGTILGQTKWHDRIVMKPALQRLHPFPAETITIADAYTTERPPPPGRPWLGLCMVTSLDGSVSIGGSSGGLGNPNDLDVLLTLREISDMVLVGAGTARGEGYGPPSNGKRIGVVTNSGHVDLDTPLFRSGAGFLIAPASANIDETKAQVLRAGVNVVNLGAAVGRLGEVLPSVTYVQVEGGPRLNGALLAGDLIDELDLSISPRLVGGQGPRLTSAAPELDRRFDLAHLLADDDGFIFSRWVRRAC